MSSFSDWCARHDISNIQMIVKCISRAIAKNCYTLYTKRRHQQMHMRHRNWFQAICDMVNIIEYCNGLQKKSPLICICIHRDHNNKKIYPLDTRIFVATGTAEHRWEKCVWFFFPIGILKSFVNKSGFCSFEQIPHTVWYYNFCMHHQLDRETQSMNLKGEKNLIIKSYSLG